MIAAVPIQVFVSHAHADKALATLFVALLRDGVGIPKSDVFCSSRPTQGVPPGEDIKDDVRDKLRSAKCVIAVLTHNFYASPYCLCELGAAWITQKPLYPITVPPFDNEDLRGILEGVRTVDVTKSAELSLLHQGIPGHLGTPVVPTPDWEEARDAFVGGFSDALASCGKARSVSAKVHDDTLVQLTEYKTAFSRRGAEIKKLEKLVEDLKAAKDRSDVARVVRAHSTEHAAFEELTESASGLLATLSSPVREALFYRERGEAYRPGRDDWDDVSSDMEYQTLLEDEDHTGCMVPNLKKGSVRRASDALATLSKWIRNASDAFLTEYAEAHDGDEPDLTSRAFWDRHF